MLFRAKKYLDTNQGVFCFLNHTTYETSITKEHSDKN